MAMVDVDGDGGWMAMADDGVDHARDWRFMEEDDSDSDGATFTDAFAGKCHGGAFISSNRPPPQL